MQTLLSEKILGGLGILLLVGAVALTVWLSQRQQELRQRAQVTSCQVERAICKWDSVGAGYSYKVNIIDVSTGTIIVSSSVTNTQLSFPASPGKTYRCEVSAVNACGEGTKTTSSNSACPGVQAQAPAIVSTPTPTPTPIPTPTPTPTPVAPTPTPVTIQATPTPPTPTPVVIVQAPPTSLPAVGPADILAKFGGGALLFTIIGIILLFAL